jgi:hypothetical protein
VLNRRNKRGKQKSKNKHECPATATFVLQHANNTRQQRQTNKQQRPIHLLQPLSSKTKAKTETNKQTSSTISYVHPSSKLITGSTKGLLVSGQMKDEDSSNTPAHHSLAEPIAAAAAAEAALSSILIRRREGCGFVVVVVCLCVF